MAGLPLNKPRNRPIGFPPEMLQKLSEIHENRNSCVVPYLFHPELNYDWTTPEGQILLEETYHAHFEHIEGECELRLINVKKVYDWTYDEAVETLKFIRDFYIFRNPNCYANPEQFWDLSVDSPCMTSFVRYMEKVREYCKMF
jgi:hypothetical protein